MTWVSSKFLENQLNTSGCNYLWGKFPKGLGKETEYFRDGSTRIQAPSLISKEDSRDRTGRGVVGDKLRFPATKEAKQEIITSQLAWISVLRSYHKIKTKKTGDTAWRCSLAFMRPWAE